MCRINYDNRKFASVHYSENGGVSSITVFHYHQKDDCVWAEYAGDAIVFGNLIAKVLENDSLEMRYQHLNEKGELMTGKCVSIPVILPDGRIRLLEDWQWTNEDFSCGDSVIEEVTGL